MKIKSIMTLALLALVLLSALCLTACRQDAKERHVHNIILELAVEPTCDTAGRTESQRCTACGQMTVPPVYLPPLGHTYTMEWEIDTPATEEQNGQMSRHCTVCGKHSAVSVIPRIIPQSEGLVFTLNEEETGYICVGLENGFHPTELHIPSTHLGLPVVEIGARAFENNKTLTAVTVPTSVKTISKAAFSGCSRLIAANVPDTVAYIADSVFKGTAIYADSGLWLNGMLYVGNHLIEVQSSYAKGDFVVPDGTVNIGGTAFMNCTGLTSVTVPEGVLSLGNSAFYGCSGLRQIHLPDSLRTLGNGALAYCISLVEFRLPMSVDLIMSNPFPGSTALQRIEVDPRNETFHSEGNCLIETATGILTIGCVTSKIPADGSVTRIGTAAFYECGSLIKLNIPEGITEIGISAFHECVNLLEISLPSTLTLIERQAFRGCVGLTEIILPAKLETLSEGAFCYCNRLETVVVPDGIVTIEANAFAFCKNLKKLNLPDSLRTLGAAALSNCLQLEFEEFGNCLYLDNWLIGTANTEITSATLKKTTVGIGSSAFSGCRKLESITIPSSVKYIGDAAFLSCYQLVAVRIPEGVTTLNPRTFAYCTFLRDLYLPSTLTSIGPNTLLQCSSLTALHYSGTTQGWAAVEKAEDWDSEAGEFAMFYN